MSKYIVTTKEVHAYDFSVDADSKEEALKLVADGQGEEVEEQDRLNSYLYSMDTDLWEVEEDFTLRNSDGSEWQPPDLIIDHPEWDTAKTFYKERKQND
jgi:hypothetical protein